MHLEPFYVSVQMVTHWMLTEHVKILMSVKQEITSVQKLRVNAKTQLEGM